MKRFFLLIVALVCATTLSAAEYKYSRDIIYRADNDYAKTMCRIDIATPEGATDAPVIVWFHGGGLTGGKREIPAALLNGQ
ncbi:MAG: alpha/beta hydrolase, partial [Alistipes sp.]|nr:alpha/beta hydrolase [Alistipes sp.]